MIDLCSSAWIQWPGPDGRGISFLIWRYFSCPLERALNALRRDFEQELLLLQEETL